MGMETKTAATLAAALVIGFAAGWAAHRPVPEPAPRVPSASHAELGQKAEGPGTGTGTRSGPGKRSPEPVTRTALEAAIEAVPAPKATRGTGRVTGTVRAKSGGVAGAKVTLSPSSEERKVGEDLASQVRAWVEDQKRTEALKRSTTTDASGAYAFKDLVPGKYGIQVEAPAWRLEGDFGEVATDAVRDFTAAAVGRIDFAVLLPDGSAPEQAYIRLEKPGESTATNWGHGQTEMDVEPGTWDVTAQSGNDGEWSCEKVPVTVPAGGPPVRLTLRLKGRPGLRGKVIRPADEAPGERDYVSVHLLRLGRQKPDLERLRDEGMNTSVSRSNEDRYSFVNDVKPGRYLVGLSRGNGTEVVASQVVEVGESLVTLDLELPPVDPAKAITLAAFGPQGERLDEVDVSVQWETAHGSGGTGVALVRKGDGTLLVPLDLGAVLRRYNQLEEGEEPPADMKVTLFVSAGQFGQKHVELPAGARGGQTATVRFGATGTLAVAITGYAASDLEGRLEVWVERRDLSDEERRYSGRESARFDGDGKATFERLEVGRYDLVLAVEAGTGSRNRNALPAAVATVDIRAGENQASFALPAVFGLSVDLGGPGQVSLTLVEEGRENHGYSVSAQVGRSGRAAFERLPAGRYQLGGYVENQWGQMEVTVPAPGGAVRYRPAPPQPQPEQPEGDR